MSTDSRATEYQQADVERWEGPDENDGEWPYPTRYERRKLLTGPLADAVRRRLGVDATTPVEITEEEISGGYSEFTQETDYCMTIWCGRVGKEFNEWTAERNFSSLLRWLDELPTRSAVSDA